MIVFNVIKVNKETTIRNIKRLIIYEIVTIQQSF